MKKYLLIPMLLGAFLKSASAQSDADALRYSQTSLAGTARFTSMAGAFGALGGDFSSIAINPAGLGIYRKSEFTAEIKNKEANLELTQANLEDKKKVLKTKRAELDSIIAETEKEETHLEKISQKARAIADERLLSAYQRVRSNARNGLAVVAVQRDACGGCFNKIPPQRQLEIRQHKKVIVCEHCGRILVDSSIEEENSVPA